MTDPVSWFEALVLGIVQGLTEFLPISSSAHILIVSTLFGWGDPGDGGDATRFEGPGTNPAELPR